MIFIIIELTSFLGKTNDLDLVVNDLFSKYNKKMVGIGFSLGAQLLMKYLGESKEHQKRFSVAASICQGYDLGEYVDNIFLYLLFVNYLFFYLHTILYVFLFLVVARFFKIGKICVGFTIWLSQRIC